MRDIVASHMFRFVQIVAPSRDFVLDIVASDMFRFVQIVVPLSMTAMTVILFFDI